MTSILQDAAAFTADKDFGARENHYETDVNPLDEVLAEKGSSANETQARKDWDADKKEEEMDELVKGMSLVCTLMIGKVFGHINLSSNVGARPSSISQNLAPPISIDSFTPFQQFGPEFTSHEVL